MKAAIRGSREHVGADDDEVDSPTAEEAFEKATLSINKQKVIKDVWQRETRKPLPNNEGLITNFEIQFARILPSDEQGSNLKKYVVYDLTCRQDTSSAADTNPTTIERRYTDFLRLFDALRKDFPQLLINVVFPKKKIMGNFNSELISERALAFENFLDFVLTIPELRDSISFLSFLQDDDLSKACRLLDERRNEVAVPILENIFQLVNKIYLDKSKPVLLLLCRLVAACTTSPIPHPSSEKWAELALRRFDHVSDVELLVLYIPLLNTCSYLFWQKGRDAKQIQDRLEEMGRKGIKIKDTLTLSQAIHAMDTRSETS
ncbi:CLUMA_CG010786, isoform A [Clunio marinus]|uniref:CLUMA_CG010786, isoform A n=1 Tax=Clunio marinus TaxID=568069 RepID=A0A1J1ICW4_9DIPT|nr:CLUMA_CG010786, isoform A [Clunio marinus]